MKFNSQKEYLVIAKVIASIVLVWILYIKFFDSKDFELSEFLMEIKKIAFSPFSLLTIILLSILNWVSDTIVWFSMVRKLEKNSFNQVLKANLVSQFLGLITPLSIGEYGSKMALFQSNLKKKQSLVITLSYRLSKSVVKLVLGSFAGLFFLYSFSNFNDNMYVYLILLICMTLVTTYFSEDIFKLILKLPFLRNKEENEWLQSHHLKINKTLLPAAIKFLSYCLQFGIILSLLEEDFALFHGLIIGILIYSIGSFIPQFSIIDPIITASIGIALTSNAIPQSALIMATLIVWLLNVGIPAIYGLLIWIKKPNSIES